MDDFKIGQIISFGNYNWIVLDIQNKAALIITDYIAEQRPYHDIYKDTTWVDCESRKYLNGEFYNKFNEADKSRIIPITNKNPDNPWYGTKSGEDTRDSIFLLNLEEVCIYFGDSSARLQNRGNHRYWNAKDENNSKRITRYAGNSYNSWWWLRSPGRNNRLDAYVHGNGCVGVNGNNITNPGGGIRPALWLKMDL